MIKQIAIRGFDKNFSYFVGDEDSREIVVVDPGDTDHLVAEINLHGYKVKGILITHSHFDHIEGIGPMLEYFEVPVYMHKNAEDRVEAAGKFAMYLDEGNQLKVGELMIDVMHTPGHIEDAVCYLVKEDNGLITGDTLFVEGCGRADRPGADPEKLYKSLQRLKELPVDMKVYPGHDYGSRKVSTIGWELKKNRFMLCDSLEAFLKERMG